MARVMVEVEPEVRERLDKQFFSFKTLTAAFSYQARRGGRVKIMPKFRDARI